MAFNNRTTIEQINMSNQLSARKDSSKNTRSLCSHSEKLSYCVVLTVLFLVAMMNQELGVATSLEEIMDMSTFTILSLNAESDGKTMGDNGSRRPSVAKA